MATKVYLNGSVLCEAVTFSVTPGRQTRIRTGSFGSPGASIPGLSEPDRFELIVPLSAGQLAVIQDNVEVEEEGSRRSLLVSRSEMTSVGHRLTGVVRSA